MKLTSMVDFVLKSFKELDDVNYRKDLAEYVNNTHKHAKFLKQPLKLEMFVPCDEDGNVIKTPNACICTDLCRLCKNYQKAKEKVLFEGFEYKQETETAYYLLNDGVFTIFISKNEKRTIQDLVKCNITLTPNAKKLFK